MSERMECRMKASYTIIADRVPLAKQSAETAEGVRDRIGVAVLYRANGRRRVYDRSRGARDGDGDDIRNITSKHDVPSVALSPITGNSWPRTKLDYLEKKLIDKTQ